MSGLAGITFGVTWLTLGGVSWFVYHLLRQNGRLLMRLETLEADVARTRFATDMGRPPFGRSLARSRINRDGLPAGRVAPAFRLPRVGGGELSLDDYRGRRVLLVFSDPNCAPCNALAPRLEQLSRSAPIDVLMISRGDPAANRAKIDEYGLTFPVVLQRHWEISREYAKFATPIAYLIDERSVIAADVAVGIESILALLAPPSPAVAALRPRLASVGPH
jgi:peroxiredoxin